MLISEQGKADMMVYHLQFDSQWFPDALGLHVDDLAGLAVDPRGEGAGGGVSRAQSGQSADRVRAAVLGQRARDYLCGDDGLVRLIARKYVFL